MKSHLFIKSSHIIFLKAWSKGDVYRIKLIFIFNNRQATKYLSRVCFFALFVISQSNVFSQCDIPGYTFGGNYNGHSYYISECFATWTTAKALAESVGGHLATISDANENSFAVEMVDHTCVWDYAWIGLTDEVVEGVFVWVTGEPLIYQNWANPGGPEEDYTEVYSSFYGGNWGSYESPPVVGIYIVEFESLTCDCDNPSYAGYSSSISVCSNAVPFDLIGLLRMCGDPDPGGTWSPALASGGNIYDPAIDGSGTFIYAVSSSGCPDDTASITIDVIDAETLIISGVPATICESNNPINLPTNTRWHFRVLVRSWSNRQ
jgi:hypothetical protein